jgi:hypothetical protein
MAELQTFRSYLEQVVTNQIQWDDNFGRILKAQFSQSQEETKVFTKLYAGGKPEEHASDAEQASGLYRADLLDKVFTELSASTQAKKEGKPMFLKRIFTNTK